MLRETAKRKEKWDNDDTTALARAFLSMRDSGEMKTFLRDLLTESEIIEFAKRFRAARSLSKSIHYSAIQEDTGLSTRTIARVKKWYKHGAGGYKLAIKRWKHQI
ncbi:MAG: DNA-binding transcriptional regulator [Parcubacteria group bacterium]|nr:DNA-binding transcriptional regulator [Parcubacteria group bacterium]